MENKIPQLLALLKKLRLKSEEKRHAREQLLQFIKDNPVRTDGLVRLDQQGVNTALRSNKLSLMRSLQFVGSLRTMSIFLVIALLVGGGISAAAEGALPGDPLFPVKVTVNDNIRSALAVSNESQARLDAKLAHRRLEEAEKLTSEGKFDAEAQAVAEMYFEQRAKSARRNITHLEAEGETESAIEIGSELESSLRVHENILLTLGERKEAKATVSPLVAKVRSNTKALYETRLAAEKDLTAGASLRTESASQNSEDMKAETRTEVEVAARNRLEATQNKIVEVRKYIDNHRAELEEKAVAEAEARLKIAENTIVEGRAKLEAKAYANAFILFQKAHRIAQEAKLLLKAIKDLNIDLKINGQVESNWEVDGKPSSSIDPAIDGGGRSPDLIKIQLR